jgi:hypothetical protein
MPGRLDSQTISINSRRLFARVRATGVAWSALGDIARDFSLTDDELAGALGIDHRELTKMMQPGATPPTFSNDIEHRVVELAQLYAHLQLTFRSPAAIPHWLRAESHYLGGRTAASMLRDGQIKRVDAALEALDFGAFV